MQRLLLFLACLIVLASPGCAYNRQQGWHWRGLTSGEVRDAVHGALDEYPTDPSVPDDPFKKERNQFHRDAAPTPDFKP